MTPDRRDQEKLLRLPSWAGYLLIAVDILRRPLFLVPGLGTVMALAMVLPLHSFWLQAGVLLLMAFLTFIGIMHAVMVRVDQQGELAAWVAHLAQHTVFGRWLVRRLKRWHDSRKP